MTRAPAAAGKNTRNAADIRRLHYFFVKSKKKWQSDIG
jgi:hypothetical protein